MSNKKLTPDGKVEITVKEGIISTKPRTFHAVFLISSNRQISILERTQNVCVLYC
jgi:hypothetical protein